MRTSMQILSENILALTTPDDPVENDPNEDMDDGKDEKKTIKKPLGLDSTNVDPDNKTDTMDNDRRIRKRSKRRKQRKVIRGQQA